MSFIIPTAKDNLNYDWDSNSRANGAFAETGEALPATRNTKSAGWLPISGANAMGFVNTLASSATGDLRGVLSRF